MREWQRNYVIKDYWLYTYFLSLFFSSIVHIFIVFHLIANELQYQEEKKKKEKKLSGFKVPSKSPGIAQEKKNSLKEPIKVHPPSSIKGGKKKKT